MIRSLMMMALAAGLLTGCSWPWLGKDEPKEQAQKTQTIGIGWGGQEWRSCDVDKTCPKPTTKTVLLPAPQLQTTGQTPLPEIQAAKPEPVVAHKVHFKFAQAVPTQDGVDRLTRILQEIRASHVIHITGHTDDIGGSHFNERLALRRAEFVAAWLKRRGIRIPMEVEAKGKCCYLAPNDTDDGRAANRRVEVVLRERQSDLAGNKSSTTKKETVR